MPKAWLRDRRLLSRLGLLLGLLVLASRLAAQERPPGSVRGLVVDKDYDAPLRQARVTILELQLAVSSGEDGTFRFPAVPPGAYTLSITKDGYERSLYSGVIVLPGQVSDVRVALVSEVVDLEELVVTGDDLFSDSEAGLLEVRSAAVNVQDAVSAETLAKTGAGDVAGALKFVVGASVVQGKYATIRGLSDRYTGTTLNGVRLPTADARRRAVQIDLFPTGTIDDVTVFKTFTPDLQGDFTGGGVDIRTRSVPDGPLLSGSAGAEYNTKASGNDRFLTYPGSGARYLGFAGSERDLPEEADEKLPPFPNPTYNPNPAQMAAAEKWDAMVRSFEPVMGVNRQAPGGNTSFSLVAGNRFDLGSERTLGVLGAFTESHKYDFYERGQNNSYQISEPDQPLVAVAPRVDSRGVDEVLASLLASASFRAGPRHEVGLRIVANQSAEDESRYQVLGTTNVEQNQSLHYTERSLRSWQLYGDHHWPDAAWKGIGFDWVAACNASRQNEPDVRFFRNTFDQSTLSGGKPSNSTDADNSRRIFRDIDEEGWQAALNLRFPFTLSGNEGLVKAGLFADRIDRNYAQQSFYYVFPSQPGNNPASRSNQEKGLFVAASREQLWTDFFLRPDRIGLAGNRCPAGGTISKPSALNCAARDQLLWVLEADDENDVDYQGDQNIGALYAMAEIPLHPKLKFIGGARFETTGLSIRPENRFGVVNVIEVQPSGDRGVIQIPQAEGATDIDESSLLPSLGVVYALTPKMNLRASWSRTLARPTFRELAPLATEEFLAGDEFVGNPDLRITQIVNHDLRWEWFRQPGEVLAVSLFEKQLTDPIELVSFFAGGRTFVEPVNYRRGQVRGAEFEIRYPLGEVLPPLEGLEIGTNFTIIHSEVEVPSFEQASLAPFNLDEPRRRLLGQPKYLFNANLTWDSDRLGSSAGVFYNVVGDMLLTGAAKGSDGGVPSTFETVFRTLDATVTQRILSEPWNLSVTFKAKNLLHPDRRTEFRTPEEDSLVKSVHQTGATYSLVFGLKW
ncbi:MAG TPA: TonB-dependent receptor [Candidatus Polarisedimenticolia bacterium]|jgi:TonB-dependent receptor|nr:TonB-dependent receptor [Candidatus Polarisedimenticolia bacterium]